MIFFQICNEGRQNALAEILEVLTEVCETYKLPLAQTWVPCRYRSVVAYGGGLKKIFLSFDGSCMRQICLSATDVAFYVVDAHMWGFREACAEHHLQKGQDCDEQLKLLDSILATMKQGLQNLMIGTGRTLEEEKKHMEIIEVSMDENPDLQFDSTSLQVVETLLKTDASNIGRVGKNKCVEERDGTSTSILQSKLAVAIPGAWKLYQ